MSAEPTCFIISRGGNTRVVVPPVDRRPGSPTGFDETLSAACIQAVLEAGRQDLNVCLSLLVEGECPLETRGIVLCAAVELVCNAVRHGFYQRWRGNIDLVCRFARPSDVTLDIADDGWGFRLEETKAGSGFLFLRSLGELSRCAEREVPADRTTFLRLRIAAARFADRPPPVLEYAPASA